MMWIAASAALTLALAPASPPSPTRPPPALIAAGGEFTDRAGGTHHWEINRAHALIWDGKPYIPAGVVLHVSGARLTDSHAPPVSRVLDLLVAHGVKDACLIRPGGWLAGDTATDQALVDALEARGLRYGIALDARPEAPLSGYRATPSRIEVPSQWRQPGRLLRCSADLPGARSAVYALVDMESDSVVASGRVSVINGSARVEITTRPSRRMFAPGPARLLLVPEMELGGVPEERPVDFWSGWEDTQRRLASRLAAVKWGPGLRFFARPAPASFGLHGEGEDFIPASGGFRLQFESWLERRSTLQP